ncbi:MAG: hypothetical protein P0Y55_03740 [Candidatus Cohnella colombiensis]|uniref:Uncharacterized protein n=1 Tax=Candidatus Cohnella colombiensis TaxID=3121368 RepID=A0AA95EYN0_9BACL|nr:MAG: hypothetical protein P0Y55_03740 [Cohnella sp.]
MADLREMGLYAALRARPGLPPLSPEHPWHPGLDLDIVALSESELAQEYPDGKQSAPAWKATLHLWNDSLNHAHDLVQYLDTLTGSVLHGIVHRRKGDFNNARYWLRHAGDHPAYHSLQSRSQVWLQQERIPLTAIGKGIEAIRGQGSWNPSLFINIVEMQETQLGQLETSTLLEQLQQLELEAMLRYLGGRLSINVVD